jgi:exonuclease SbcC
VKLHRLELEGFGPFRDRQVVEFDAFDQHGIFLIAGPTGSGKSSILDGVCFALYGGVPRYEGAERRLRSDHCAPEDPTEVRLEFTVGDTRWRVTRAPEYERPKARGTGLTTLPHAARVEQLVDGAWIGRAAGPRDVGLLLDEVLGLSQQQFLQVILLAQNRFAQFLLARNDDRQALLRRLFGSRTYSDYQDAFEQRRRAAGERLAGERGVVDHLLDDAERMVAEHGLGATGRDADDGGEAPAGTDARLEAIGRAIQRAAYRLETLQRERDEAEVAQLAADAAHAELIALRRKQERRDASRVALAALDAQAAGIAADRARVAAAEAGERLRDVVERAERSTAVAAQARSAEAAALTAWTDQGERPIAAEELAQRIEHMTGDLAVWAAAAEQERALQGLRTRLAELEQAATQHADGLRDLDERLAAHPAQAKEVEDALKAVREPAALVEPRRIARTEIERRLEAARAAEQLDSRRIDAERDHAEASAAAADAHAAVTALLQRRLAGAAGELAAQLVDGEPCAVCGAREHPQPAHPTDDPVTDADIDVADAVKNAAADAERAAADAARSARDAQAAQVALAGGESAERLAAAAAAAEDALAEAERAAVERDRLDAELDRLTAARTADAQARTALAEALAAVRGEIGIAETKATAARTAVDAARGEHETVAERIADTTRRRTAAQTLAKAMSTRADRDAEADAAVAERDARVGASEFADAAAVVAALLSEAEREGLSTRIREHDVAQASEVERLRDLELELAGQPDEPLDVAASAAALTEAKARWAQAVERAVRAERTVEALQDRHTRAVQAHAEIAALSEEHALIAGLADAVAGRNAKKMDLETFVLAAELEEIVGAANLRLDDMSSGRYLLRHTDAPTGRGAAGLGLEVVDAYTGHARPPQSLSGGETFLASLALALGLAQVVTARAGGIRLDTLFIDEGFGSLDGDTLELAMRTLDELRQGGRTVGVISHVEAMKEQLPAQLLVRATPQGPSVVQPRDRAAV